MIPLLILLFAQDISSTKEAMRSVQTLVGKWNVTISPEAGEGWQEVQAWEYKIDKEEYGLQFVVQDGKRLKEGSLSYDLKRKLYRFQTTGVEGKLFTYEGRVDGKDLILEQITDDKSSQEKLTFHFLRDNRIIGSIEKRQPGTRTWTETHKVQFTKQGVPFVKTTPPKCVVTGGTGEMEVSFAGVTYRVCCNTCRKEFAASPEKTIANAKKEGWIK
jgi:hypothetical protein